MACVYYAIFRYEFSCCTVKRYKNKNLKMLNIKFELTNLLKV